ncbi:rhodanese-like domain-containing protein [Candidatus Saccharibacteria bacterium]|nr:rhodanese-like domain-containing protein [Candidatus Saccharibacteria bacterium]
MKKIIIVLAIIVLGTGGVFVAMNVTGTEKNESVGASENKTPQKLTYQKITVDEAKSIMNSDKPYLLWDVRTEEEFAAGHLPDAVSVPDSEIKERAKMEAPDKNTLIMVYCRSGARSSRAAAELVKMGYTNVRDIGGIIDWPDDVLVQ